MGKVSERNLKVLIVLGFALFIFFGLARVYYGGNIGFKIMAKNSFSFTDTIVNLDDIIGMPRIIVAAQHPAVKRQLEDAGYIQTDEDIQRKIKKEISEEMDRASERVRQALGH